MQYIHKRKGKEKKEGYRDVSKEKMEKKIGKKGKEGEY